MASASNRVGREQLRVLIDDRGTTRIVSPCGEIDIATVSSVSTSLTTALSDGFDTVVLDLRRTTFIDSTGIAAALRGWELAQRNATRFVVIPGPPRVHDTFVICGLVDHLPFADDADEAGKEDGH
jgi:anti-anti-sigma factor